MAATQNPFGTASMAEGYARSRPPLHRRIIERAFALSALRPPVGLALDSGCGSGLSTRPLLDFAQRVIGIDPVAGMAALAREVAPGAWFLAGRAEALPVRSGSVDLITAAGSLNYSEPQAALCEAKRALAPGGAMCVYDFSQGRASRESPALARWFTAEFERRYPMPHGEAIRLDPGILNRISPDFPVIRSEAFELGVAMTRSAYADYILTETNVAAAVRDGAGMAEIRSWLDESLRPVFGDGTQEVLFPGYLAWMQPQIG